MYRFCPNIEAIESDYLHMFMLYTKSQTKFRITFSNASLYLSSIQQRWKDFLSCSVSCPLPGGKQRLRSRETEWLPREGEEGGSPGGNWPLCVDEWVFFRYLCSLVLKGNRDSLPSVPKSIVRNLPHLGTPLFSWLWNGGSLEFAGMCCLGMSPGEALLWVFHV